MPKRCFRRLLCLIAVLALTLPTPAGRAADDEPEGLMEPFPFLDTVFKQHLFTLERGTSSINFQMQGACTDGRYIWAGWNYRCAITRLDLTTWEMVTREYSAEDWPYAHVNDMTYNPNTNLVYVVAYDPNDNSTRGDIGVFDPMTLEHIETIHLSHDGAMIRINGLAYDRAADQYIVSLTASNGRKFVFLDADFQYLRTVSTAENEPLVLQGIETDGTYIYRALWELNVNNYIRVIDFEGNIVATIDTDTTESALELEDLMYDWNGNWYMNFARDRGLGGEFYYTRLTPSHDNSQLENLLGRLGTTVSLVM